MQFYFVLDTITDDIVIIIWLMQIFLQILFIKISRNYYCFLICVNSINVKFVYLARENIFIVNYISSFCTLNL